MEWEEWVQKTLGEMAWRGHPLGWARIRPGRRWCATFVTLRKCRARRNPLLLMTLWGEVVALLSAPATLEALAGANGLDYLTMEKMANSEGQTAAEEGAVSEMDTLKHIKAYLERTRPTIRVNGNLVAVTLRTIPTRLIEVEKRRMRVLLRGGVVNRRNCANPVKPEMYRCGFAGRGGAVLNGTKIRQALKPHCRARRNMPGVRSIFNFELQRG